MASDEDCVRPKTLFCLYVGTTKQKMIALFPYIIEFLIAITYLK